MSPVGIRFGRGEMGTQGVGYPCGSTRPMCTHLCEQRLAGSVGIHLGNEVTEDYNKSYCKAWKVLFLVLIKY